MFGDALTRKRKIMSRIKIKRRTSRRIRSKNSIRCLAVVILILIQILPLILFIVTWSLLE